MRLICWQFADILQNNPYCLPLLFIGTLAGKTCLFALKLR
jgi:hypothetical protein